MNRIAKTLLVALVVLLFAANANTQTWEQTNGPSGGTVPCLAINSSDDIFVGTFGGGVFRIRWF